MHFRFVQRAAASLMMVVLVACGSELAMPAVDDQAETEFFAAKGGNKGLAVAVAVQSCVTLTLDGPMHGDVINSLAVPLAGGFNLTVAVTPGGALSDNVAKAYDSSVPHADGDDDLQTGALCPACDGNLLVIPNIDFAGMGDSSDGGTITLTGFPAVGETTIKSYSAIDQDNAGDPVAETGIVLEIDDVVTGVSSGLGNGTVDNVAATETPIVAKAEFTLAGSGAVDNLEICHTPPPPTNPGTGTIGFWKQHPDAWPVEMITVGGAPFTKAQAIAAMQAPGRGDKTFDLFAQLVAAKLNVLIGNDDSCVADAIMMADAFLTMNPLGSNVRANSAQWQGTGSALHSTLTNYNEGKLCAPKRDD